MASDPLGQSKVPKRARVAGVLELRSVSFDHPDARALTERAQAYYVEIYGGPDDDPLTAAQLRPPTGGFVVAYADRRPAGMGGWTRTDEAPGEAVAQIRRMFVDHGVRRRGIARAVLAHLEDDARRHGSTAMVLATGRPQTAAIAFYRSSGYHDVAPFGFYAATDLVVCLGKELGPGQPSS